MDEIKKFAAAIEKAIDGLRTVHREMVAKEPVFPPEAQERLDKGICLVCGLPLSDSPGRPSRGNHPKCYKLVQRTLAASGETETDAITQGLLSPAPAQSGRKPANASLADLKAKQKPPKRKT